MNSNINHLKIWIFGYLNLNPENGHGWSNKNIILENFGIELKVFRPLIIWKLMKLDDLSLFYHSGSEKIIGIFKIVREYYPDYTDTNKHLVS